MVGDAGSGALRELLMVLAVAGMGLLLAMVAAFTPWYTSRVSRPTAGVVGLHQPGELDDSFVQVGEAAGS